MNNRILQTSHANNTDMNIRPPIKNNLNEQLKIYYTYRDEAIREHLNNVENRPLSQLTFRHIPKEPPITRHHTVPSQILSSNTKGDSNSVTKLSNKIDKSQQSPLTIDTSSISSLPITYSSSNQFTLDRSTSPSIDRSSFSFSSSSSSSCVKIERSMPNTICPLCQISFDTAGIHRPVNDACGHTTCFQCFKTTMLQATGCSLCQKEEEFNSQLSDLNYDSTSDKFQNCNQSNDLNHFQDAFFDEWSLDQVSSSKTPLKSIENFDDNNNNNNNADDTGFDTYDHIPSIDYDEEKCDKVTWISADVYDDGPEYRDKDFSHTKTMLERFHALFGLRKFRSNQQEAINCALERRYHLFILMPTGGGKSLCYQLPAVLDQGITFVVSPLRSLILDQTQKLLSLGIPCAALTGDRTSAEVSAIYAQCYAPQPKLKLVYITPEKIGQSDQLNKLFSHLYAKNNLARFVIDEAHCISDWGHDFRPDYVKIGTLRDRYPRVPFILLTATATPRVQRDMLHQMKLDRHLSKLFIQSFNRSNLVYRCFPKGKTDGALARTAQLCLSEQFVGMCGIVYCFSRAECEKSAAYLTKSGVTAQAYHAGLDDQDRTDVQTRWANDEYQVICATIAFGMGIDKPNVRFVIHLSMPKSIEGYYQESGRAGRDGEQAYCYLFYSYQDLIKTKRLIMTDQSALLLLLLLSSKFSMDFNGVFEEDT
ncbi:unnamed protein product [Rotaria sp. Silwood2]|nr:unnamed protein product [Rotaria sp. Silwood2]